jgi:predicted RNA binding protein YcfA (HicA-like mRNA interferase family)
LPRLKYLSGRDVCNILKRNGFEEIRRKGSHIVMQKREGDKTHTVIVPDHREIKKGTLMSIIRQSNLPRSEFATD